VSFDSPNVFSPCTGAALSAHWESFAAEQSADSYWLFRGLLRLFRAWMPGLPPNGPNAVDNRLAYYYQPTWLRSREQFMPKHSVALFCLSFRLA